MDILVNFDLFSVGMAIAGIGVLGFTVFFNNRKSVTNKSFLFLALAAVSWSFFNYTYYKVGDISVSFLILKFVMFSAVWLVFCLFRLLFVFPDDDRKLPQWFFYFLFPTTFLVSILTLTNIVFRKVSLVENGHISQIENGPGIIVFGVLVLALIISGLVIFYRKTYLREGEERKQFVLVWSGFFTSFFLLITFNFILPAFFNQPNFIQFGALFMLPIVVFTSFAIYRHGLFNIKVATTASLVFVLSIGILFEVFFSDTAVLLVFRSSLFILVLCVGILLIRSVLREVLQREKIQILADELDIANKRQSELLYFVTHQVKGFLTNTRSSLSMILEGDYGVVPENFKEALTQTFESESRGVEMVQGFLNASKIEQGTMQYDMKEFDLGGLVNKIIAGLSASASAKGLQLENNINQDKTCLVVGDRVQLGEAISNLIDNSIKYTPSGKITVSLDSKGGKILLAVKDTGVGITTEDMEKLFTKYGHGKESRKINVNSNGLGLYLVKKIIDDHKGKVWAESEGKNKGSQFYIELSAKI